MKFTHIEELSIIVVEPVVMMVVRVVVVVFEFGDIHKQ